MAEEIVTIKAKLKDLNNNVYVTPEIPNATPLETGLVKPDNDTILVSSDGTIRVSSSVSPDGNVATIQVKRATSTTFSTDNPVLEAGEWAYVTDLQKVKIGDGTTHFND